MDVPKAFASKPRSDRRSAVTDSDHVPAKIAIGRTPISFLAKLLRQVQNDRHGQT